MIDELASEYMIDQSRVYGCGSIGSLVLAGTIDSAAQKIDVSDLPSNVYLLKIGNTTYRFLKH